MLFSGGDRLKAMTIITSSNTTMQCTTDLILGRPLRYSFIAHVHWQQRVTHDKCHMMPGDCCAYRPRGCCCPPPPRRQHLHQQPCMQQRRLQLCPRVCPVRLQPQLRGCTPALPPCIMTGSGFCLTTRGELPVAAAAAASCSFDCLFCFNHVSANGFLQR